MDPDITKVWRKPRKKLRKQNLVIDQEQPPPDFKEYIISLRVDNPDAEEDFLTNVNGWSYSESGLGYYQNPANLLEFLPVHLPTGINLSESAMTEDNCKSFIKALANIKNLNWHQVGEDGPPKKALVVLLAVRAKYE